MKYLRLTRDDRYQIQALNASGQSIRAIGRQLSRAASTISRELRKGSVGGGVYCACEAQQLTLKYRHRPRMKLRKIQGSLERRVRAQLREEWSPQQISVHLRHKEIAEISYPSIYRYLERDKHSGGKLSNYLRVLRKQRKDRKRPQWKPKQYLPDRISIEQRPSIVEKRSRLGDYERDTVLGKRGKSVLLTIVDRTSRLVKIACVRKNTSDAIHRATVRLLKGEPCHTITNDNGFEFSHHRKTSKTLKVPIYFSNPYCSWERGTNENTNGLLRQYFPKKKDIGNPSARRIRRIEMKLNNRPRKVLGYRTPLEVHNQLKAEGVALDV